MFHGVFSGWMNLVQNKKPQKPAKTIYSIYTLRETNIYPFLKARFEDDFPFPEVEYVMLFSSLQGMCSVKPMTYVFSPGFSKIA